MSEFETTRFLRAREIRRRFSISDATLYRWTKDGMLPEPQYLNGARVWRQSVIEDAEARMLASDQRIPNRLEA